MEKIDVLILLFLIISLLIYGLSLGFQTPQGLGTFMFLYALSLIVPIYLSLTFFKSLSIKEASKRELEAEDSIFLQAVAFSQSTLWIILNLIAQDRITAFLKLFVPIAAVLCYSLRAYGKLKNNNKWRYFSVIALFLVFAGSLGTIIKIILIPTWENLMLIESIDVTESIIISPLALIPTILAISIRERLKIRYGL